MNEENEESGADKELTEKEQQRDRVNQAIGFGVGSFIIAAMSWVFLSDDTILLAGLALYVIGFAGGGVLWWRSPVSLYDERKVESEHEAGWITLMIAIFAVIFGFPVALTLEVTGIYAPPQLLLGVLSGYMLLAFVFLFAFWYVQ